MRKLSKAEIKKRDCGFCSDCYKIKYNKMQDAVGYKPVDGEKRINIYCKHEKCPYKKENDTITSFALFDRVGNYFG